MSSKQRELLGAVFYSHVLHSVGVFTDLRASSIVPTLTMKIARIPLIAKYRASVHVSVSDVCNFDLIDAVWC